MQKGKPAKKYSQAGRLHTIIRLFESRRGMTLDELAEECGIDRRTVHRDIAALQEAGYSVSSEWQAGKKIYSFLTRSRNIPPITFTLSQLMSLYLLRSLAVHLTGTPFMAEIDELYRSINSVLPDRYAAHLERIARVSLPILHGARDYSGVANHLPNLQKALLHQYRVRISYSKKGGDTQEIYEVNPYTLVFHKEGIYLLGYTLNRNGMRLFALERIREVDVTRQRFDIPEEYQPEAHFGSAFGLVSDTVMKVRVRFSAEVANVVKERIWMTGQEVITDAEGCVTIVFQAAGERELISWILSYGMHAEVLEPLELRREVKRQIRAMRQFYRSKDKKGGKSDKSR